MNEGKKFEEQFKKSMPDHVWWNRYKDGTKWMKGDNTHFQVFNIADFEFNDGNYQYIAELKSTAQQSIPFKNIVDFDKKSSVQKFEEMKRATLFDFLYPCYIFNFRKNEKTYCIHAKYVIDYIETADRKSIPFDWCVINGIELKGYKMRTNWKYDVKQLLRVIGG